MEKFGIGILILSVVTGSVGTIFNKYYSLTGNIIYSVLFIGFLIISGITGIFAMKYSGLSYIPYIFTIMGLNILITILSGYILFNDPLSLKQILFSILIVIGVAGYFIK